MKHLKLIFLFLMLASAAHAQVVRVDSVAIMILDRMSSVIGDLNACSFSLEISEDVPDNSFFVPLEGIGLVKHFRTSEVYIGGSDQMMINSRGDKGHRGYWYDGERMVYYSYSENNFALIPAAEELIAAIDEVNELYGIDFPAADFFYPYFVDDLLENSTHLVYLGETQIRGKSCFHLIAAGEELSTQLWISNDGLTLPLKMVITYLDEVPNPQYEVTFTDWQLNPNLPPSLFRFMPPPNAREINILPKPQN